MADYLHYTEEMLGRIPLSTVVRFLRSVGAAIAMIVFCAIALQGQSRRTNTNVGQATLRIHVIVMPIISSRQEEIVAPKDEAVVYDVPLPKPQSEVTVQQLPLPAETKTVAGRKAEDTVLLTSTIVQQ